MFSYEFNLQACYWLLWYKTKKYTCRWECERKGKRDTFQRRNVFIYRASVYDHGSHVVSSIGCIRGIESAGINVYGPTIRVEHPWFRSSKTMCVFGPAKRMKINAFYQTGFQTCQALCTCYKHDYKGCVLYISVFRKLITSATAAAAAAVATTVVRS